MRTVRGLAKAVLVLAGFGAMVPAQAEHVVVAFGTSLTARGSWPDELAAALHLSVPEGVGLVRVAEAGKNSEWGLWALARVINAQPDLVLIEFAINDADIFDGVTIERSLYNHLSIIKALRTALPEVRVALLTTNPAFGPRGWRRPSLNKYYNLYRKIAAEGDVRLIDVHAVWVNSRYNDRKYELLPDGLHPTDAASAEIALPLIKHSVMRMLDIE